MYVYPILIRTEKYEDNLKRICISETIIINWKIHIITVCSRVFSCNTLKDVQISFSEHYYLTTGVEWICVWKKLYLPYRALVMLSYIWTNEKWKYRLQEGIKTWSCTLQSTPFSHLTTAEHINQIVFSANLHHKFITIVCLLHTNLCQKHVRQCLNSSKRTRSSNTTPVIMCSMKCEQPPFILH